MQARVAGFIGSVQLQIKIAEATSSSDEVTPVYILDEVLSLVGSNRDAIDTATNAIVQRLKARSATVKQKALRLTRHACLKGDAALRSRLTHLASPAVRDLLSYRCDPDPFKGDIPWKRVQELAKDTLTAMHAGPEAAVGGASHALQGRIQGMGSGDAGGGGAAFSASSSRMVGFGSGAAGPQGTGPTSGGAGLWAGGGSELGGAPTHAGAPPQRAPGGGGLLQQGAMGGGGPTAALPHSPSPASAEERVVARLAAPGGVRATPSAEDLRSFLTAAMGLDGARVAAALWGHLENPALTWQSRLRVLCGIEAALEERAGTPLAAAVCTQFQSRASGLRAAAAQPQASVRERAAHVLTLVGAGPARVAEGGRAGRGADGPGGAAPDVPDLLGDLPSSAMAAPSEALPAGAVPHPSASASPIPDLMDNLEGPTDGNLCQPSRVLQSATQGSNSNVMDLLAGLDIGPPARAPSALPHLSAPALAQPADDDWLGFASAGSTGTAGDVAAAPSLPPQSAGPQPGPPAPHPAAAPLDMGFLGAAAPGPWPPAANLTAAGLDLSGASSELQARSSSTGSRGSQPAGSSPKGSSRPPALNGRVEAVGARKDGAFDFVSSLLTQR
ncbi:hypothetical protein ACKKBG_A02350 [Auxenochlorella protothecoides x Auxenochlorella symbiontica]